MDWHFYLGYQKDAAILPRMPALFERHPEIAAFYPASPHGVDLTLVFEKWQQWGRSREPLDDWLASEETKAHSGGIPFLESDRELVDYLRHRFFWYLGRSKLVPAEMKRLERQLVKRLGGRRVSCPECQEDLDMDQDVYGRYVPIMDSR